LERFDPDPIIIFRASAKAMKEEIRAAERKLRLLEGNVVWT